MVAGAPEGQSLPIRLGVIPAAGAGVRAYPRTAYVPKTLLEVGGKPLIQRNIELLRDQLGVRDIVVIVGHLADQIREFLGSGERFGVRVQFVDVGDPRQGLALGLHSARSLLTEPFYAILGDELYLGTDHSRFLRLEPPWEAACAVISSQDVQGIQKNYALTIENGRVTEVEEKPAIVKQPWLGCGTYAFKPSIFSAIERTERNPRSGRVELTDAIGTLVREGMPVHAVELDGNYINVNSIEDQNSANYAVRCREFASYKVSVVIPAWNEEESIGRVVADFLPCAHEVVVADNVSRDRTAEIARGLGAKVISQPLAGYGAALRCGMDHAQGDILVLVEADHSFRSKDLGKLLEYMKDADMVMGTRTTRQMIEQGTNMRGLVRWANVFVGKLIEALWWNQEPRFTDVGCTYRAVWRDVYEKIRPRLEGIGPEFAPELMIEVLRMRRRVIEVPVSYYARVGGSSKHSRNTWALAKTATKMLRLVFKKRFGGSAPSPARSLSRPSSRSAAESSSRAGEAPNGAPGQGDPLDRVAERWHRDVQSGWRAFPVRDAVRLAIALCEVLPHARSNLAALGPLHPGCVVRAPSGSFRLLYTPAFLAGSRDPRSEPYLAPELRLCTPAQATPAGDVFAIGAILFHLLVGKPATTEAGRSREQAREPQALFEMRTPYFQTPAPLRSICRRALEERPERRYSSPAELRTDLLAWSDNLAGAAFR